MEMDVVKISSRGQIVLPAKIRKEFGLDRGDKLIIERGYHNLKTGRKVI